MSKRPEYFRSVVLAAATALILSNGAFAETAMPRPPIGPPSVADLAEGVLDAVVNISISQNVKSSEDNAPMPQVPEGSPHQEFFDEFFKGQRGGARPRTVNSLGSGFIVDPAGYIVTNNHVVQDADDIEINLSDGTSLKAKLVGMDTKTDLALLKVEPKTPLKAVTFGDSRKIRIGDWVMVVGNPFGLGVSVSVGVVSARGRNINAGPYDNFIQTDAAINRGNSGGPLFNMQGEVIGINTAILSQTGMSVGIGFAVPAELAVNVVNQLKEFGETRRGWLGVRIQPVSDDIAESLKMERPHGALVSGIIEGGPIAHGEIKAGDIITRFDGADIAETRDLIRAVGESAVGKAVDVVIIREGKEQTVRITLGRLEDGEQLAKAVTVPEGQGTEPQDPQAAPLPASDAVLGMKLAVLDEDRRKAFGIAETIEGVVVTEVRPNSPAAERRLEPGDVIVEVGQEAMATPEDVTARVEALKADGRRNALLMIANKSGELRFVTVRME
ncbi:Do family serine endopeptidase [Sinorhizobium alkalisoli]|uniref:Probable periplasmic serine endoprotease DegP-like n=1 Tax=Sinorhizobium alkalisoli TaxID=1752398 RepID=A0A1E3V5Z5_9HYPH|nr:Do family serine endopeptidase [Sinorhizobium alkalisoli]MCA1491706.1 Do family serine endopeptidase [Ensifer sp. NBAIM29]MCG5480018.1 Do family serine endopeptidase [Sinorhizobium alkalisoli]ODR88266.1 serine protease [Sinorhizobium alkalisoli]QFI66993.1 HtrA protease/chaperone protein [Sinorhizobium alkalisoli]